jgi:D-alanine--D-alanine ligase
VTWDPSTGRPLALAGGVHDPDEGRNALFSLDHIRGRVVDEIGFPVVLKPNSEGSSVGVEIVREPSGFADAFARVAARSHDLLIERYIPGRELTATIFLARRLPLIEIRPRQGFYDYANKYTAGATEYLVPAPVHSPLYEQISGDALRLFDLLECRGLARVDIRLDGDEHHCLELNTIPGLTPTSLVPKAAAAVGIGFADLIEDLCRAALERRPPANMVPGDRP